MRHAEVSGQEAPHGRLATGNAEFQVSQSTQHLGQDGDNDAGSALLHDREPSPEPRFRADQIQFKKGSTTSAVGLGVGTALGATAFAGSVGAGVAAGLIAGGVIGTAIPIPIVGTVAGMLVGAAIGGVVGLVGGSIAGGVVYDDQSTRRANNYLDEATRRLRLRGREFSGDEKRRLESIDPLQWKKLLKIKDDQIVGKDARRVARDMLVERAATGGLADAQHVKDQLLRVAAIRDQDASTPGDREKIQRAVIDRAARNGITAARRFKADLTQLVTGMRNGFDAFSAEDLLDRRETEDNRTRMLPLDVRQALHDPQQRAVLLTWVRASPADHGLGSAHDADGLEAIMDLLARAPQMEDHAFAEAFRVVYDAHVASLDTGLNLSDSTREQFSLAAKSGDRASRLRMLNTAVDRYVQTLGNQAQSFLDWHRNNAVMPSTQDAIDLRLASHEASTLDDSLQGENARNAASNFIRNHTDALLLDDFWTAEVARGVQAPRFMVEHIAPQLALDVIDRVSQGRSLTAEDITAFNKAIDPDGSYGQPPPLSEDLHGRPVNEQLRRTMIDAVRGRYTDREPASFLMSGPPKMDLTQRQKDALNRVFDDPSATADARIAAFTDMLAYQQEKSGKDIIASLRGALIQDDGR
ncbi:MAG: hypothetical protein H6955_20090 [Chromatiaceae bacterium]|nr:hypothetical protein [Chromatiaceae bacterium]